jgi:hypothetical protein
MRRHGICRIAVLAVLLASCQDFLIYDVFLEPLAIDPGSALIYSDETATFSASGGRPGYEFGVVSGGGSIDPATGVYTAPSAMSEVVIQVTDATGKNVRADIEVLGPRPVVIAPSAVTMLVSKSCVFAGHGGIPPYSYVVTSGNGSINSSTGVFTASGASGTSTVTLTDGRGLSAIATISVQEPQHVLILPALVALKVSSSIWFLAIGGQPPYVFTQTSGSGSMTAAGLYTAGTSSETAMVMVTDALGSTSSATVTIVAAGALGLDATATSVEEGKTAGFSAYGGTPDYFYSLSFNGSGGSINGSTGEYTAGHVVGSNIDTVLVTDSDLPAGTVELKVSVLPAAPSGLAADGSYGNPHEIALVWTDNSTSEDGFIVERKSGADSFAAVGYTATNVATFVDTTCAPNVGYTYRIKSYKGALGSGYSNEAFDLPN